MATSHMQMIGPAFQQLDLNDRKRQERPWPKPSTPEQKYLAKMIRCGNLEEARSFVKGFSLESKRKLTEDSSLMLVALRENKPEFIRFLVKNCNTELERSVKKAARPSDAEDVDTFITPLRYATKYKKTEAAMELMRLGANLSAASPKTGLNALHDACKSGALAIVKELLKRGSDLTKKNKDGCTALMCAVDYVNVCRILIKRGAEVNATDNSGDTALHQILTVRRNNAETAELLIKNGADLFKKNNCGEDAFSIICNDQVTDTFKAMIDKMPDADARHKAMIRSHQLLGAKAILYHDPTGSRVAEALGEWEISIRLRDERRHVATAGENDIVSTPTAAYDNAVEVDSMAKFEEMRQDPNKIYMQGLLLTEKILGPTYGMTATSVLCLADYYMRSKDYGRGLRLLKHGFKLSRTCSYSMKFCETEYLVHLYQVGKYHDITFDAHAINSAVDFEDVYKFLETVTLEARRLGPPTTDKELVSFYKRDGNSRFMDIIFFLIKLFFLLKKNELQTSRFKKLLNDFVQLNVRSFEGRTFLMNAIRPIRVSRYASNERFTVDVDVIKLLLECGEGAGEVDYNGNSVLHLLAKSEQLSLSAARNVTRKEENRKVAEMLLAFGAHFDARNKEGLSASDYLSSLGIDLPSLMTLQYLSAQVIRRHRIPCEEFLPKLLIDYVRLH